MSFFWSLFFFAAYPSVIISLGVYEEIYPEVTVPLESTQSCDLQRNGTCPIFIAFMISFGGIYKSSGAIPALQIALDEINNDSTILPGYTLHYTLKDSNCDREVSLSSFYTQMFQPPTKLAIIGSGCSVATEPSAESAPFFNLTQTSCLSSSPALSNRAQYKTHFQMLASESLLAYGYLAIVEHFGWRQVAIIAQAETLFTDVMALVVNQLQATGISYTEKLFRSIDGISSLGDRLFDPSARIYLLSMYSLPAMEFLCRAHQEKKHYPLYQFIFPGWYGDEWWVGDEATQMYLMEKYHCSVEDRKHILAYSLTVLQDEFLTNNSTVIENGNTGSRFYEAYERKLRSSQYDLEPIIYAQQCYDGAWTIARALNKTMMALEGNETLRDWVNQFSQKPLNETFQLHHFTYNNSAMLETMMENMANTDFLGLTGQIKFDENGVKQNEFCTVNQYRPVASGKLSLMQVARVNFSDTSELRFLYEIDVNDTNLWEHGLIPYDGIHNDIEVTVAVEITGIFSILATVGLVLTLACFIFNFKYRHTKLMKLSSPNLNYLILTGAVLLYVNIYLFIIPTSHVPTISILCNITLWFASLGFSLCFGTIVMKMGRIFYIFNNAMSTKAKRTIHDWMLGIGVMILVAIDIALLCIYTITNRDDLKARKIISSENPQHVEGILRVVTDRYICICDSANRTVTLSIIYGIKGVLQIIALLFAFSIRKVKVKGLDDSPFIIAAIYVSSIVLAVFLISSITLKDFENAFAAVYCSGFFIGTTMVLLLVFVPKMRTLYRDPKGAKIFKHIAPVLEVNSTTVCQKKPAKERRISLHNTVEGHQHRIEKFQKIPDEVRANSISNSTASSKATEAVITPGYKEEKKPRRVLKHYITESQLV